MNVSPPVEIGQAQNVNSLSFTRLLTMCLMFLFPFFVCFLGKYNLTIVQISKIPELIGVQQKLHLITDILRENGENVQTLWHAT